jgi:hypothetical protein
MSKFYDTLLKLHSRWPTFSTCRRSIPCSRPYVGAFCLRFSRLCIVVDRLLWTTSTRRPSVSECGRRCSSNAFVRYLIMLSPHTHAHTRRNGLYTCTLPSVPVSPKSGSPPPPPYVNAVVAASHSVNGTKTLQIMMSCSLGATQDVVLISRCRRLAAAVRRS